MSTAVATAVELMTWAPESLRTEQLFRALQAAAPRCGLSVTRTSAYRGHAPWLLLWGPGAPARAAVLKRHVAAGGRALCLDLAYWNRERKARVSIDAAHPVAQVMQRNYSADRWRSDSVPVADVWGPKGPVLIAGLGDKARVQYGAAVIDHWERSMITACRARWPERPIAYRRKKTTSPIPEGVSPASGIPIDQALKGVSLVVTWHSNVAVDAIRMGIPVVCRDGAAAAICPSSLPDVDPRPLPVAWRDQFLFNVSHFQWGTTPDEAAGFWKFATERLS